MDTLLNSRKNLLLFFSFLFVGVVPAFSEEPCARVVVVIGEVRNQEGREFKRGQKISRGEEIRTAEMSLAKVMLSDDSMLDIGPSTRIKITHCESEKLAAKINLELELGTVRALVSKTPKKKREEFRIKTATTVIGVRGTEFFVSWQKNAEGLVNEQIGVKEGEVEIRSLFDQSAKPIKLTNGVEFRAQGTLEEAEGKVNVVPSTPPQVDQFTAEEQREAEQNTKIENSPFESSLNLSPKEDPQGEKVAAFLETTSTDTKPLAQREIASQNSGNLNTMRNPGSELSGNTFLNNPIPVSVPVTLSWRITQ